MLSCVGITVLSCNKTQLDNTALNTQPVLTVQSRSKSQKANPFSVVRMQKASADLGRTEPLNPNNIYYYYSFDPSKLTGEMLSILESDTHHHILDYPFANGDAFTDAFMADFESNRNAAKDGNLYIVFKTSESLNALFQKNLALSAILLDELYLPDSSDEALQLQAIANAQNIPVEQLKISWPCFFQQPHGRVTYLDQETNQNRSVPNIQVWALAFGIPVSTWTDANGNYRIPWFFSVGTVMGTHAKNPFVIVKPLNTTGNFLDVILQVIGNFIMGSVHVEGTASACQMKNDININFNQNDQKRYWAQILDVVRLHHTFTAQDRINPAPLGLAWYALWSDERGSFSAPMLSHMSMNPISTIASILSLVFDTNIAVNAPNFFNLLTGLLPSITTKESRTSTQSPHYSERLMQWSLHELAHASFFTQVGQLYWERVIINIIAGSTTLCGGYGCGTEVFAGDTQLNEAWAEFIGKEHHRRVHPAGQCEIDANNWVNYPAALEDDPSFQNDWIPTGVFFDLMDATNLRTEPNDQIQGFTIAQQYNVFSPNIHSFCEYRDRFIQLNPSVSTTQFNGVLRQNNFTNCK
jgi:hypothetical protein